MLARLTGITAALGFLASGLAQAEDADDDTRHAALVMIGTIAFESPDLLGGTAAALGMSCASCHPRGGTQTRLFIDTLSDKPGNVDVTNGVFSPLTEDNIINPVNIPSLFGARHTAPFGRRGNFETVGDFTIHAVVNEFIGQQPSDLLLEALVAFQKDLDFPANRFIDDDGRLLADASESARRGEAIFNAPDACATCHKPHDYFVDHSIHDVGTDGKFETPSLRGSAITAPYAHDGRFDSLAAAVDYFVGWLRLDLDAAGKADLLAYVETIGATDPTEPPSEEQALRQRFSDFGELMRRLIALNDTDLTKLAVAHINRSFKPIQMYYRDPPHRAARLVLGEWMEALRAVQRHAESGEPTAAREALLTYNSRVETDALSMPGQTSGDAKRY